MFALTGALSVALQSLGERIRSLGVHRMGGIYWYIVAPGVACHETGHALGCLITGTKVFKFVPFYPQGNTLGYVQHEARGGWRGSICDVIISTGPIWFGALMIAFIGKLLMSPNAMSMLGVMDCGSGFADAIFRWLGAVFELFFALVSGSLFAGWKTIVGGYLIFCIASEMGMSWVDAMHMRRGLMVLVIALVVMTLMPICGFIMIKMLPFFVCLNAIMALALLVGMLVHGVVIVLR